MSNSLTPPSPINWPTKEGWYLVENTTRDLKDRPTTIRRVVCMHQLIWSGYHGREQQWLSAGLYLYVDGYYQDPRTYFTTDGVPWEDLTFIPLDLEEISGRYRGRLIYPRTSL